MAGRPRRRLRQARLLPGPLALLLLCWVAPAAMAAGPLHDSIGAPLADPRLVVGDLADALRRRDIQLHFSLLGGPPHPTNLGADLTFARKLALGVTGGFFGVTSEHVRLVARNLEARLRWYPLWSWLSLGVVLGREWLTLDASEEVETGFWIFKSTTTVSAKVRMRRTYLAPNLGFDWSIGKGLTLAAQLGYELPFEPWWSVDVDGSGLFGWVVDLADGLGLFKGFDKGVAVAARSAVPYVVLRIQWNV